MTERISYTVAEASEATGISESAIRAAHRKGDLEFRYPTSHPVVLHDDLLAWVSSAPTAPRKQSS